MLLNHAWKWFMGLLLAGLLPCAASPPPAPVDDSILVVSWNIEWFPGRLPKANPADARQHMVAAKTALGELAPDVLLLQEIADWDAALELVSDIPGMQVHVVSEFHERPQNLVIASKLPVDAAWFELWKDATPATPPRGFAFAALRLPDGRFLLCYTVHYKSNHGDAEANFGMRQQASRQLLEHAVSMLEIYSRRGECVLLIGGDFNSSVDDPQFINDQSVRALQFAGLSWIHAGVPFEKRVTWPARGDFADTCFDHIFAAPAELISVQVPHLPEISDHNPIVARYRFPAGPSPTLSLGHLDSIAPTPVSREQIPEASTAGIAGRAESRDVSGNATSADNTDALKRLEGRNVRVQGVVRRVGESPSGHMVFINFGTRRGDFTAIVRRNHVRSVSAIQAGKDLGESLPGRRLEVRGRIELYKGSPQIEVTKPGQLRFL